MRKTRLCQEFMSTGACKYSDKCTFAHGTSELRAADGSSAAAGSEVSGFNSSPASSLSGDILRLFGPCNRDRCYLIAV